MNQNSSKHIGNFIQKLRIEAGISRKEMASRIAKSNSLVSFIESKGKVNDKTLKAIAKVLNVAFETLKVYPYMEFDSNISDTDALRRRIAEQEKEIELLKKVVDGYERVFKIMEAKEK